MSRYLAAHRVRAMGGWALIITSLAVWLSSETVPMPQVLRGYMAPLPVPLVFSVFHAACVLATLTPPALALEATATRGLQRYDLMLVGCVSLVPTVAVGTVAVWFGDRESTLAVVRDNGFSVAIALGAAAMLGYERAAAVPAVVTVVLSALGAANVVPRSGFNPLSPSTSPAAAVAATAAAIGAGCLTGRIRRRVSMTTA